MGFDQVSLFLYPPRWQAHSVADLKGKHASGKPVQVVSDVRQEECDEPKVLVEPMSQWLLGKGFNAVRCTEKVAEFHSAPIESVFGPSAEIEVFAAVNGDEISGLCCRFLLNRETPVRMNGWEAFVHEFCTIFSLRIHKSDTEYVGPDLFLSVVHENYNWLSFAQRYGWSEFPTES